MIYYVTNQEIIQGSTDYEKTTLEYIFEYFKDKKEIQFDTETEFNTRNPKALPNPYENKLLCYQLGDFNNQFVVNNEEFPLNKVKKLLERTDIIVLMCNAFFDLRYLYYYSINIHNLWDCFLVERALTRGKKFEKGYLGLNGLCQRYVGVSLNKDIRGEIHWRGLDNRVIRYASEDVKYMGIIKEKQEKTILKEDVQKYINLENIFCLTLARISYKGFKIDKQKWLDIAAQNKILLQEKIEQLDAYIIDNNISEFIDTQYDLFDDYIKTSINWSSSQQVIKLFKKLGINTKVIDSDKGGFKDSVDSSNLIKQKDKFDILPIYLSYKEIEKELSTYGEDFIKQHYNPISKRVHSEFFQIVDTGRISSSKPNLQNISATTDKGELNPLRKCFVADEGNVLIINDFSQQEPRITADKSQDPVLLDFVLNGDGDSHSLTATAISSYLLGEEIKVTKKNNPLVPKYKQKIRDIGKMINLGLDYGKSAYSVKDDLNTSKEEAQALIDLLGGKFPKKQEYFKNCQDFALKNGYVITDSTTNAKTYFKDWEEFKKLKEIPYEQRTKKQNSDFYKLKGSIERGAQNYPIQGTGGVMTKCAAILFDKEISKLGINAFIVNLIHDEIVVECPIKYSNDVMNILTNSMIKAGEIFCKSVPMKVDPIISEFWSK
jgi:DNA polymerase-1